MGLCKRSNYVSWQQTETKVQFKTDNKRGTYYCKE